MKRKLMLSATTVLMVSTAEAAKAPVPSGLVVVLAKEKADPKKRAKAQNPTAAQRQQVQAFMKENVGATCKFNAEFLALIMQNEPGKAIEFKPGLRAMVEQMKQLDPKVRFKESETTQQLIFSGFGKNMIMVASQQGLPKDRMMVLQCELEGKIKANYFNPRPSN